jgi:phage-related protein
VINYSGSPDEFKINGVSCKSVNVWCDTPPVPPMAQRRYTTYDSGYDEDSTVPDESFEDIPYTLTFFTFDNQNYSNSDIYNFFANAKTLQISKLSGFYYKIRKVVSVEPSVSYRGSKIKYTARLVLAPFRYSTSDDYESFSSQNISIENNGNRFSKPIIEVYGRVITISVNGDELFSIHLSAAKTLVIDSEKLITYDKSNGEIIMNAVSGKYPLLNIGQNSLVFTGSSQIKVKRNERWY